MLTAWLQFGGIATLIDSVRGALAADIHKLGSLVFAFAARLISRSRALEAPAYFPASYPVRPATRNDYKRETVFDVARIVVDENVL